MTSTQSRRMARIVGSWWKAWWSTGVRVETPNEIYKYAAPLRPTVVADTTQESWRGRIAFAGRQRICTGMPKDEMIPPFALPLSHPRPFLRAFRDAFHTGKRRSNEEII